MHLNDLPASYNRIVSISPGQVLTLVRDSVNGNVVLNYQASAHRPIAEGQTVFINGMRFYIDHVEWAMLTAQDGKQHAVQDLLVTQI